MGTAGFTQAKPTEQEGEKPASEWRHPQKPAAKLPSEKGKTFSKQDRADQWLENAEADEQPSACFKPSTCVFQTLRVCVSNPPRGKSDRRNEPEKRQRLQTITKGQAVKRAGAGLVL